MEDLTNYTEKIVVLFRSIQKNLRDLMLEKIQQYGLTFPQFIVICNLFENPGLSLTELSDKVGLSKSTVSGIIYRLEKQGVVLREIPEENRRTVKLLLSPVYLKENDIIHIKEKILEEIIDQKITPEDAKAIIQGLEKLDTIIKRF